MYMNKADNKPKDKKTKVVVAFEAMTPKKKKREKKIKPKKKKVSKSSKRVAPLTPPPDLGVEFSGVDFGLPEFTFDEVGGMSDELLGEMDNLVMTEGTVDETPEPRMTSPVSYPPRARANNVEGRVVVNILVGVDGSVRMMKIVESNPSGVFDDAVKQSVRNWKFSPAMYQSRPVEIWVSKPFDFNLN
ncbi:MAG: energy transducer TonB [Planctomycetes bacterium]|nr:energy transducer TonB [Planctomycetota bacterium]